MLPSTLSGGGAPKRGALSVRRGANMQRYATGMNVKKGFSILCGEELHVNLFHTEFRCLPDKKEALSKPSFILPIQIGGNFE